MVVDVDVDVTMAGVVVVVVVDVVFVVVVVPGAVARVPIAGWLVGVVVVVVVVFGVQSWGKEEEEGGVELLSFVCGGCCGCGCWCLVW